MKSFTNQKGQPVGTLKDGSFIKNVSKSKHLMKSMNAWGVDKDILVALMKEQCRWITIQEREEQVKYRVPFDVFISKGIERDFGHGAQVFLPLDYFNKIDEKGRILIGNVQTWNENQKKII